MKPPRLSKRSISALQKVITGDPIADGKEPVAPYLRGSALVSFFNEFGADDTYDDDFPSRWVYVERKLSEMNGTMPLLGVIEEAVAPARFLDTNYESADAVTYLNRYLAFEHLELVLSGTKYRLQHAGDRLVEVESRLESRDPTSRDFIEEQLLKCGKKIQSADYDGAITNARSLLEAVLYEIEGRLVADRPDYDGDLLKLYKRVQKAMNLDPSRPDISDSLKQVLSGLTNIVGGLAPLRNKMGDAHVRTHKPDRHHAKLAVNAAKTLTDFLVDSLNFQKASGRVKEVH